MILGKSRKIRTFTGVDALRFNDVSGHRIFHAAETKKSDSERIRALILDAYAAYLEPNTSSYFRFSKEYGLVSTNIGTMRRLISRSGIVCA